jgi:hypothetical protein
MMMVAGAILASSPTASADAVKLKDGRVIERVGVAVIGSVVTLSRELGSITLPADEVAAVVPVDHWLDRDELERRRLAAAGDPEALATLATWAAERGLESHAKTILSAARTIDVQRRLAPLATARDARGYVELASWMGAAGFANDQREAVLAKGLARFPDDAEALRALDDLERADRARAQAAEARREAREREKSEREARIADEVSRASETAAHESAARARDSSSSYFIPATPDYPPHDEYEATRQVYSGGGRRCCR